MADTRSARRAGIQAEISVVTMHTAAATMRPAGETISFICTPVPMLKAPKASRRAHRVMPMPRHPTTAPITMPTLPSSTAS